MVLNMSLEKERIAVVIGKDGETKELLEKRTGTKITIRSETGEYNIESNPDAKPIDSTQELDAPEFRVYVTNQILKAINTGFNPMKSLKLLDHEYLFEISDLEDALGHSESKLKRIKGRIIGEEGKIRNAIEQFSGVYLSVYNKYLAFIGTFEGIKIAKKAINMLIQGAPHKAVLNYLQKEHDAQKKEDFKTIWKPTI
jgi:ribosomal RNA assembly protein